MSPGIALIALLADAAFGWPDAIFRRIGHPVVWIGMAIERLERRLNHGEGRFAKGIAASLLVILAAILPALFLQSLLGPVAAGLLAWPLVAAKSLHSHVRAVEDSLLEQDLAQARLATAQIVGRDVSQSNEAALSRASIESLAENSSDGVIAPLFWAAIAGLPGIAAYKAINTLDSMIGHRNARYAEFGRFAARLDDAANWFPARLTAVLMVLASGSWQTWRITRRDAYRHRSPNAGWPEAAMAAALQVRLSGPRSYGKHFVDEPWLNGTERDPSGRDIRHALALYRRTLIAAGLFLLLLSLAQ
ncbi:adenosylcobinamide-phosphate synthase CbiB [Paracoccus onubensis]|uniref:Cobalamin biosynthesis protein CobD n=1 Tax=Paracoccus onubensis TaxID=1675788 RepID=A0A418T481_9RHOB|nr:adenosylcobinamide-phosphate synthase CbiB [Paracoccus onubensis]RJE87994.1 cobalamin biosynthesis protein CobD [Paracoccus onubensis]